MLSNGSGFGKNVIIFSADIISLVHIDNWNKDILIPGKGLKDGLDDTTLTGEKEYSTDFMEEQENFCLSLHYNGLNSYVFFNGVEMYKFKAKDSEINTAPLALGNFSRNFKLMMWKTLDYTDMSTIF